MGIKAKVIVGVTTGVIGGLATWLGFRKKRGQRLEKVNAMISDVDLKEPEKEEEKQVLTEDVKKQIVNVFANMKPEEMENAIKAAVNELLENNEDLKTIDNLTEEEVLKELERSTAEAEAADVPKEKVLHNIEEVDELFTGEKKPEKTTPEEWERQKQEKAEKNWQEKAEKAIQNKDFYEMERLFDQKYAGGPWHPSPASVFGDARNDKIITDELYDEAMHFFGKLWNYSGD